MHLAPNSSPLAALEGLHELEQLINERLFGDWFIVVEHADMASCGRNQWLRWGAPHGSVRDGTVVIDAVLACRACYPGHFIRLNAQKLRPYSNLLYWIYHPDEAKDDSDRIESAPLQPLPLQNGKERHAVNGWDVWRYATFAGLAVAAAFVLEDAVAARFFG